MGDEGGGGVDFVAEKVNESSFKTDRTEIDGEKVNESSFEIDHTNESSFKTDRCTSFETDRTEIETATPPPEQEAVP